MQLTYNKRSIRWHLRVYKSAARLAMMRLDPDTRDYLCDPTRPQRFREEVDGMIWKEIAWDADLAAWRRSQPALK